MKTARKIIDYAYLYRSEWPEIINRSEAKAKAKGDGANRYFTGKACRSGHVSERDAWGACLVCSKAYRQTPEYKAYDKNRNQEPKSKAKRKERYEASDYKLLYRTSEYRAYQRERYQTPKVKAQRKAHYQTLEYVASMLKTRFGGKVPEEYTMAIKNQRDMKRALKQMKETTTTTTK